MSDQPAHQERHAEALENHDHLSSSLKADVDGIRAACNQLHAVREQASVVLQHASTTLLHVNPTAAAAITNLSLSTSHLLNDIPVRTTRLHDLIRAIPEPSLPPPQAGPDPTLRRLVEHIVISVVTDTLRIEGRDHGTIDSDTRPGNALPFDREVALRVSISIAARLSIARPSAHNYFVLAGAMGDERPSIAEVTDCLVEIINEQLATKEPQEAETEPASPVPVP